jgi:hypothetical protein
MQVFDDDGRPLLDGGSRFKDHIGWLPLKLQNIRFAMEREEAVMRQSGLASILAAFFLLLSSAAPPLKHPLIFSTT